MHHLRLTLLVLAFLSATPEAAPFQPQYGLLQQNRRRAVDYPLKFQIAPPTTKVNRNSIIESEVRGVSVLSATNPTSIDLAATKYVDNAAVRRSHFEESITITFRDLATPFLIWSTNFGQCYNHVDTTCVTSQYGRQKSPS